MTSRLLVLACVLTLVSSAVRAQPAPAVGDEGAELKFVVYMSRHGVRSPTGKSAQYNVYSVAPWPQWEVEPGYLTPHGFHLMELFGAYDRMKLASEGLFSSSGCVDAGGVSVYADSDQRTRETGKAIAQGMFPGCKMQVQSLPEGTNDPLFHYVPVEAAGPPGNLPSAAIGGRIGGDPKNLTLAYRSQIAMLDDILAHCGTASPVAKKRISLFDIPSSLSPGTGDHAAELKGPINTASTLAENLLLEYTEGMDAANVGWGCVDGEKLRALIDLHAAATDFAQRTPAVARVQASNLLDHIGKSLEQAAAGKPISGAAGKLGDRALFLIGHDTNQENIAGLLGLTWIVDGRRDDTPPGGSLVFELWKGKKTGEYAVRSYFTAQTLEQMRTSAPLSEGNPPQRIPLYLPGCSRADLACTLADFVSVIHEAIDPRNVAKR